MKKVIRRMFVVMAVLVLLPTLLLYLLLFTRPGADWLLSLLADRELIAYHNLNGSIDGGLHVESLQIYLPEGELTLTDLRLKAALSPLLYGELNIKQLLVASATLVLPQSQPISPQEKDSEQAFVLPEIFRNPRPLLPIKLGLQQVQIAELTILQGDSGHYFSNIKLAASAGQTGIESVVLGLQYRVEETLLTLALDGHLYTWPRLRSKLNIDWSAVIAGQNQKQNQSLTGQARFTGNGDKLSLEHQSAGAVVSSVKATLTNWRNEPEIDAAGEVESLNFTGETGLEVSAIKFSLSGRPANLQGNLSGRLQREGWQALPFDLDAELQDKRLLVQPLLLKAESGEVRFEGWLDWSKDIPRWQGRLFSDQFAANQFHSLLPERVSGELDVAGRFDQQLSLQLTAEKLFGTLRGTPFELSLDSQLAGKSVQLDHLDTVVGGNRLSLQGDYRADRLNLHYQIDANDLSEIYPLLSGSVEARGQIEGSPQQPTIIANAVAEALAFDQFRAQSLRLKLALSEGRVDSAEPVLVAIKPAFGELALDEMRLQIAGQWDSALVTLTAAAEQGSAALVTTVTQQESAIHGQLQRLDIEPASTQAWLLQRPVDWFYDEGQWQLSRLCLGAASSSFCASAKGDGKAVAAVLNGAALPLDWLSKFMPEPVIFEGMIDLDGDLVFKGTDVTGDFRLANSGRAQMRLAARDNRQESIDISTLSIDGSFYGQRAAARLSAKLEEIATIGGKFEIQQIQNADSPLSGQLNFEVADISPFAELLPEVEIEAGALKGEVRLSNTLVRPHLQIAADLSVPQIFLYSLGVEWRDLSASLQMSHDNKGKLSAKLNAGEGELALAGEFGFANPSDWSARFRLTGDNALLADLPGKRIVVDPSLQLAASPGAFDLQGKLRIPEALFLLEIQPGQLSLTEDAKIYSREPDQAETALTLDLAVELGSDVRFKALGLDTLLAGKLQLIRKPKGALLAYGNLSLNEGFYKAYGQKLEIDRGELVFSGSPDQPWLDIISTRKVDNITAGIHLTGEVDRLQSRLFSTPAMTDSEILAYIITGKPLGRTGQSDQNMIANAALSLAVSGSPVITNRIASATGLDEVGVSAEDGVETLGLTLGKYLNPKLYVRYGYGVVDKLNKLFVEYQLSEKLFLETEVGIGHSLDLIYRSD